MRITLLNSRARGCRLVNFGYTREYSGAVCRKFQSSRLAFHLLEEEYCNCEVHVTDKRESHDFSDHATVVVV